MSRQFAASASAARNAEDKFQQTTPTIEASLRAGVVIDLTQPLDQSLPNSTQQPVADKTPNNKGRASLSKNNSSRKRLAGSDQPQEDDFIGIFNITDDEDDQSMKPKTPSTVIRREREGRKAKKPLRKQSTAESSQLEPKSPEPMEISPEPLSPPTRLNHEIHNSTQQAASALVSMTQEINMPEVDLRGKTKMRPKSAKARIQELIEKAEQESQRAQQNNENLNNEHTRISSSQTTPNRSRDNRRSRSKSHSFNTTASHNLSSQHEAPEQPRRANEPTRRRHAQHDDNDQDHHHDDIPMMATRINEPEFVGVPPEEVSVQDHHQLNQENSHNLSNNNSNNSSRRGGVAKSDKELELEKLEQELRAALRPHIPPPRRSERLRLKRADRLHSRRIRLLDEIQARGRLVPRKFNLNLKNVAVRRGRARH